jgi:hypothetical protein
VAEGERVPGSPLVLAGWMAWGDARTRRIPNYLTLATALSGLGFQFGAHGWPGLGQGCLGLCVGFALLIGFFLKGGMGAGDVNPWQPWGPGWGLLPPCIFSFIWAFPGYPSSFFSYGAGGILRPKSVGGGPS